MGEIIVANPIVNLDGDSHLLELFHKLQAMVLYFLIIINWPYGNSAA